MVKPHASSIFLFFHEEKLHCYCACKNWSDHLFFSSFSRVLWFSKYNEKHTFAPFFQNITTEEKKFENENKHSPK